LVSHSRTGILGVCVCVCLFVFVWSTTNIGPISWWQNCRMSSLLFA